MKFSKILVGGVILLSTSLLNLSFAGVNSASVSITVIPATQTLSCYAPEGSDGCSVNLLAGLRSSSSVLIYIDANHCPIRNTYYVSASGITADIVDNHDFSTCDRSYLKDWGGRTGVATAALKNLSGLTVGSKSIRVNRNKYYEVHSCSGDEGHGNGCTYESWYHRDSSAYTYTFVVTY